MATPNRTIADRRRALRMIANYPGGCSEYVLRMHGFTVEFVFELVKDGFAAAERFLVGDQPIEVARIMITDVGRAVLEGHKTKARKAAPGPQARQRKAKRHA
jgi:hypothetical protein